MVAAALVGAVYLAHHGTHMKAAKPISMVALISIGVAALFGVVALFSTFGVDGYSGWDKTVSFFVGVAKLGIDAVAGMLILGYFQQHAPVRPAAPAAPAFAPQGQWQQPQQPQPPQQQWQPQPPQGQVPPHGGAPLRSSRFRRSSSGVLPRRRSRFRRSSRRAATPAAARTR